MKYEISKNRHALERMLFETCGEDRELVENAKVVEIDTDTYWITYNELNAIDGLNFKVKITELPYNDKTIYHFHVFDSMYADNGDFFLDYHLERD